ncbi:MgtC/SapB family protein [Blastopirellula sp. JC732]|uniref:MgtC/SapB family protein n=1 Tax=Blastopirellula sediminis TaxID=2894196 RepID=A0A9X1SHQ0_9BACT|nr:MgtC/SapB family protein [Blastopirellula sediminis]MCC9606013.1 MgtC/SapB family protein [Blastopirellula sediminis]MCC9630688.1 MgtC/SapB family protein [Blastopirellula sediminis]
MSEITIKLVAALLVGAVLGWDRERRQKSAGLRTYMLVSLGAASLMIAGLQLQQEYGGTDLVAVRLDVQRILAAIIGGVGFLGAGSIIQARHSVHGVTTAAGIWIAAAGGVACGCGYFHLAAMSAILAWIVIVGVGRFEKWYFGSDDE